MSTKIPRIKSAQRMITRMASSLFSKNQRGNTFTVAVEGNLGSGKSTFLDRFRKHDDVCVLSEPVDHWRNLNGHNLLALSHENRKQWSFTFQSMVQLSMLENHIHPTPCSIKLIERSVYSAHYCFVENLIRDGSLPKPSAAVIDQYFKWITKNTNVGLDLIVYLRTSPEVVYERILKRKRPEENPVSMDFIQSIHQLHEDWLFHKTLHSCPAPTLIINADLDQFNIEAEYERLEPKILNKMLLKAQAC